jgi:hypothetical protein
MSVVIDAMAKQALKWFDTSSDEQVLSVLAPSLIKLFERTKTPIVRQLRILRLLQSALVSAQASAAAAAAAEQK